MAEAEPTGARATQPVVISAADLAEYVQSLRRAHGMQQRNLAERAHVSESAISAWLAGKRRPTPEMLHKLAAAFAQNADDEQQIQPIFVRLMQLAGHVPEPETTWDLPAALREDPRFQALLTELATLPEDKRDAVLKVSLELAHDVRSYGTLHVIRVAIT